MNPFDLVVGIKGAGEQATGIAWRLFQSNIRNIFMMEVPTPLAVRRNVAFSDVIYQKEKEVEGVWAQKATRISAIETIWESEKIAVIVDPDWQAIKTINPDVVIDAIIAKKNLGTTMADAPLVIGIGPGFEAGESVHMVIESNRGHHLGRVITKGCAEANTGIPGKIGGFTSERVLRAPGEGHFSSDIDIGTVVDAGSVVGRVNGYTVYAEIPGIVRGLIPPGTFVNSGVKIGDIDPRGVVGHCHTISDKSRAIAGGVLEAILKSVGRQPKESQDPKNIGAQCNGMGIPTAGSAGSNCR